MLLNFTWKKFSFNENDVATPPPLSNKPNEFVLMNKPTNKFLGDRKFIQNKLNDITPTSDFKIKPKMVEVSLSSLDKFKSFKSRVDVDVFKFKDFEPKTNFKYQSTTLKQGIKDLDERNNKRVGNRDIGNYVVPQSKLYSKDTEWLDIGLRQDRAVVDDDNENVWSVPISESAKFSERARLLRAEKTEIKKRERAMLTSEFKNDLKPFKNPENLKVLTKTSEVPQKEPSALFKEKYEPKPVPNPEDTTSAGAAPPLPPQDPRKSKVVPETPLGQVDVKPVYEVGQFNDPTEIGAEIDRLIYLSARKDPQEVLKDQYYARDIIDNVLLVAKTLNIKLPDDFKMSIENITYALGLFKSRYTDGMEKMEKSKILMKTNVDESLKKLEEKLNDMPANYTPSKKIAGLFQPSPKTHRLIQDIEEYENEEGFEEEKVEDEDEESNEEEIDDDDSSIESETEALTDKEWTKLENEEPYKENNIDKFIKDVLDVLRLVDDKNANVTGNEKMEIKVRKTYIKLLKSLGEPVTRSETFNVKSMSDMLEKHSQSREHLVENKGTAKNLKKLVKETTAARSALKLETADYEQSNGNFSEKNFNKNEIMEHVREYTEKAYPIFINTLNTNEYYLSRLDDNNDLLTLLYNDAITLKYMYNEKYPSKAYPINQKYDFLKTPFDMDKYQELHNRLALVALSPFTLKHVSESTESTSKRTRSVFKLLSGLFKLHNKKTGTPSETATSKTSAVASTGQQPNINRPSSRSSSPIKTSSSAGGSKA